MSCKLYLAVRCALPFACSPAGRSAARRWPIGPRDMPRVTDEVCYVCLFVLGILTRFVMLNHPRQVLAPHRPTHARSPLPCAEHSAELQVVFDEYHFGKFVNGYITGEYFFDIHPPLGKLLLCLVAWMGGYDGRQSWDKIGVDIPPEVNLLGLRGALTRTLTLTLTPAVNRTPARTLTPSP